jgi:hypothetical protein
MRRKINYSLNTRRAKKLRDFYKLISIKLNAAKRVNKKKKSIRKKKLLTTITIKKKEYYIKNCYKKKESE